MDEKTDIQTRAHIRQLVATFYSRIRIHDELGPIFNSIITDWERHFELLTDFWETQLFLKRKYQGNPVAVHQEVDEKIDNKVTSEHFGLWLNIWFATIDDLFTGENAWVAKNRAQKMSTMLFMKIYEHRNRD